MGAGVFSDPNYQALASRMASELGGGSDLAKALLAQMACEKADGWPPQDNNPLNVHVDSMASVGITGLAHGVGDGGACASFPSPDAGADAAVELLTGASRYRAAVAAARANSGAAYLSAVTSAGWGTSYSCCVGYYSGGGSSPFAAIGAAGQDITALLGGVGGSKIPGQSGTAITSLPANAVGAAQAAPAAISDTLGGIASAIASLPSALGGALASLLVNGVVLLVILILAYKGIEMVIEPEGGSLADTAALAAGG
jgi:hypothetical protein